MSEKRPVLRIREDGGPWVDVPAIRGAPGKSPIIGDDGTWMVWSDETQSYISTGVAAGGGAALPGGGTAGQVLAKASDAPNDLMWKDPITYLEVSNDFGGKTVTIGGV